METKKKLPKILIVTFVVSAFLITFLALSIASSIGLVRRCENAINNIGEVSVDDAFEERLDKAIEYYSSLDKNIRLDKNVKNVSVLEDTKVEYVRLAIKKANVAYRTRIKNGTSDEELSEIVTFAKEKLEKYFDEEEYESIDGYQEFELLIDKYAQSEETNTNNGGASQGPVEEPEIC